MTRAVTLAEIADTNTFVVAGTSISNTKILIR
jgi:hypothetical protein